MKNSFYESHRSDIYDKNLDSSGPIFDTELYHYQERIAQLKMIDKL